MKQIVIILSLIIALQQNAIAQAQQNRTPQNKDTMLVRSNRVMQHELKLSDEQAKSIYGARKKQMDSMDSLNAKKELTPEQRSVELKRMQKEFESQLKKTLSRAQLDRYKLEESKHRDSLMQRARIHKVYIKELSAN